MLSANKSGIVETFVQNLIHSFNYDSAVSDATNPDQTLRSLSDNAHGIPLC